jgi:hypothetical protein
MKSKEFNMEKEWPREMVKMEDCWYDSLGEFHTYHEKIPYYEIDSGIARELRREKRFKSKKAKN